MLVAQSCLTLCNPMDCSPPGSSVHGILQAKCWSGSPIPSPGGWAGLPNPGTEPKFPALQADCLPFELPGKPRLRHSLFFISCLCWKHQQTIIYLSQKPGGDLKKNDSFSTSRYIYSPKLVNSASYPHCCSSRLVLTFLTLTSGYWSNLWLPAELTQN